MLRLPQRKGPIIVMTVVVSSTIGAVIYSHYAQVRDMETMKEGVERDKERLRAIRRAKLNNNNTNNPEIQQQQQQQQQQ